jgi:RimJ/RimL family protein N-acetyltransferase
VSQSVTLRDVLEADLPVLYEHQAEPEAVRVAVYPSRELDAFMTHWKTKVLGDASVRKKAVLLDAEVAGYVTGFTRDGERCLGYWFGRDFWGKGIATAAVTEFVRDHETTRPLFAHTAVSNVGSIRVLEKVGFVRVGGTRIGKDGVEEVLMGLTGP